MYYSDPLPLMGDEPFIDHAMQKGEKRMLKAS